MSSSEPYDRAFFSTVNDAGASSARGVLPVALALVDPRSAVDVGCGTGIWATALMSQGVPDVVGVDGSYVPLDQRQLEPERFLERDIRAPLNLGRTFDLALCLEVAEHLAPEHADHLVAELVAAAPAILFSAATPLQGGTDHVNEQWLDYWIARFERHGYTCWDVIRPQIRYLNDVAWIYRQNVVLVLGPDGALPDQLPAAARLTLPSEGDVSFEYVARYILDRELSARDTVGHAVTLVRRKIRGFLTR